MRTQISINPKDWSLIKELAMDFQIHSSPTKGEHLYIPREVVNRFRKKLNSVNPYPLWEKIKDILNDDDTGIFNRRYFLVEEVIHFPDRIIYVIGDGLWSENI